MATVIMIINYDCTVIMIVNYDPKTFIVQATGEIKQKTLETLVIRSHLV
jgi:hypothetical protein